MPGRWEITAKWVYHYYKSSSPSILSYTLDTHYSKWLENLTEAQSKESWAYIKGLVKLARDRKIFNERTWEIKQDDR